MADKPKLNAMGMPEPEPDQPVEPYDPRKPMGERQDGAGTAPPRRDRTEATPVGSTAARRSGPMAPPAAAHEEPMRGAPEHGDRGKPAPFTQGAAKGSGSSAGGGGAGADEDIDADSVAGGGHRPRQLSATGPRPTGGADTPHHDSH